MKVIVNILDYIYQTNRYIDPINELLYPRVEHQLSTIRG